MKKDRFDILIDKLKSVGYMIELDSKETYKFAYIKGNCIAGGVWYGNDDLVMDRLGLYGPRYKNMIVVDHKNCFDKWSRCPLKVPVPENDKQMEFLLKELAFWGTDEGYKISNEYDFDRYIKEYPKNY